VKGVDHVVIAGRELGALRSTYEQLGFTLTPVARHPFGTVNSLVQFDGCFLELLSLGSPRDIPEHRNGHFSFAAFNRDFLRARQGASMLVLDSGDARADNLAWAAAGLPTYEPFDFSRTAMLPNGEGVTVGFSLAFTRLAGAALTGFFACQQLAPQHFWKEQYQTHANGARGITEVWITAPEVAAVERFLIAFSGSAAISRASGMAKVRTARGSVIVAVAERFVEAFGHPAPDLGETRIAGLTLGVNSFEELPGQKLVAVNGRRVAVAGPVLAFEELQRR
jgi:Glyoxalase-like domain